MKSPAADRSSQRLRPGRHGLDRAFVVANQRDRILDAIAQEVASQGYAEVTVADVIARAGVSRKTFYALFRDKPDCFLAAFDAAVEILLEQVTAVFDATRAGTPERAVAAIAAMLEVFAREPSFARMCMVEAPAAGPEARERYETVVDGFLPLFERLEDYQATKRHVGSVRLSHVTPRAVIGGIAWVISQQIVAGQTERLPELLPELTYFLLAPFLGEQDAAKYSVDASRGHVRRRGDRGRGSPPDAVEAVAVRPTDSRGRRTGGYAAKMRGGATGAREEATAEPARAPRRRRPRPDDSPALTRQAIVNAALGVADADGLQAVSIRCVAAALEVGPMSLYTHVADKAELLSLMANEVVASMLVEEPLSADWREALSHHARRSHAAFVAHPWVLEVFVQRPGPHGENTVKHAKQQARAVEGLGLEPGEVWTLLAAVNDYLLGHALRVATTGAVQDLQDALSPSDQAELPELTPLVKADRARSSPEHFETGLQIVLDGIEQHFLTRRAQRGARPRARKPRAPGAAG